jgi:cyclase
MPVGIGGGISNLEDINSLLQIGADKVVLKTSILRNPEFIKSAANFFGSQCISISADVIKENNEYFIYNELGIRIKMTEFINKVQDNGAGEIVLNNVDNDGMMGGFDHLLLNEATQVCKVPIVYIGGGGDLNHYKDLFSNTDCNAIASSSIFHFTQFTPLDIKNQLREIGKPVRI